MNKIIKNYDTISFPSGFLKIHIAENVAILILDISQNTCYNPTFP